MSITRHNTDILCQTLCGVGLPENYAHQIINEVKKWESCSGAQWTIDRLKALHLWYLRRMAGDCNYRSEWFRSSKENTPTGIWGHLFKIRNPQRALAALSIHTIFKYEKVTKQQIQKFQKSVQKEFYEQAPQLENLLTSKERALLKKGVQKVLLLDPVPPIPAACMTGKSWPGYEGNLINSSDPYLGLGLSYDAMPKVVFDYLRAKKKLELVPPELIGDEANWLGCDRVGAISFIQEPSGKARVVANPNRILQHYLRPIGKVLYSVLNSMTEDCTFDQESSHYWIQCLLRNGETLYGADLSSATDTIPFDWTCQWLEDWEPSLRTLPDWKMVKDTARSLWKCEQVPGGEISWTVGQPLGTYPSFALLGIHHNICARYAAKQSGLNPENSYRVIGDDIIMLDSMREAYNQFMHSQGLEINQTKSIRSNKIAEFAGKILTHNAIYAKRVKAKCMSNSQFMTIMSQLGDSAKSLLTKKQRLVYDELKHIPGNVVKGPWMNHSYGHTFEDRWNYYLANESLFHPMKGDVALCAYDYINNMTHNIDLTSEYQKVFYALQEAHSIGKHLDVHIEGALPYSWIELNWARLLSEYQDSEKPYQAKAYDELCRFTHILSDPSYFAFNDVLLRKAQQQEAAASEDTNLQKSDTKAAHDVSIKSYDDLFPYEEYYDWVSFGQGLLPALEIILDHWKERKHGYQHLTQFN